MTTNSGIFQETIVLNDFGLAERRRTTSKGTTSRYTVTINAEPIIHTFDANALGKGPAEAIAEAIRKGIRDIGEFAKPSTRARREQAKRALAAGDRYETARYSGGRTGPTTPHQTDRLFNDSGRLAESITVNAQRDATWTVNVAKNRLDPSTFVGGLSALLPMFERLRNLVPALQGPEQLARIPEVAQSLVDAHRLLVRDLKRVNETRAIGKWKTIASIAKQAADIAGLTR